MIYVAFFETGTAFVAEPALDPWAMQLEKYMLYLYCCATSELAIYIFVFTVFLHWERCEK